jgi:hypothetical protein
MGQATSQTPAAVDLLEERMAAVHIDGERHSLVWIHDESLRVSMLVDRPEGDSGEALLLGSFAAGEPLEAIEALIADYREHYVKRPRAERPRPRAIEPRDLAPPAPPGEAG